MILAIKTDNPQAELHLIDNNEVIESIEWQAHRQLADTIHLKIKDLLSNNKQELTGLTGIIVFQGPGSFTGLRIGISVANVIAYSLKIPIVGCQTDNWLKNGIDNLQNNQNDKVVLPHYGSLPNITKPKK